MKLPELLAACQEEESLRFLLIGGHAVIAHGYARTTFDVDLLVCRDQVRSWTAKLESLGYRLARQEEAFAQFEPPPNSDPLDLMMVNAATFEGMFRAAQDVHIGGQSVKIPSLDHLLALKLHVLKQNLGHRVVKDLDDVIRLVLANRLDIRGEHYAMLFAKYGTQQDYQRVLKATSGA